VISENTKAILLLTTYFNTKDVGSYKPFSINEYGYFACWLHQNGYKPVDLFSENKLVQLSHSWDEPLSHEKAKKIVGFTRLENTISSITIDKIKALLSRGTSLSLALDKWQSAGVWIMDRQHTNYPQSFKKQLKHQSPALLFGVGNQELLNQPAIGFVGSRDCTSQDEEATNHYVKEINSLNYQVVSGAAKGVDSHAMLYSLSNGNTAIGILADSLYKASASSQWRQHLKDNRLVLISPFHPEGRFTPANAMARNKYIYLSSKATVVVCSGEKGGTWEGAKENLKKSWVPLLVSNHQEPLQAGNQALLSGFPKTDSKAKELRVKDTLAQINQYISDEQISDLSADAIKLQEKVPQSTNVEKKHTIEGKLRDESPSHMPPVTGLNVTKDMFHEDTGSTIPSAFEGSSSLGETGKNVDAEKLLPSENDTLTKQVTAEMASNLDAGDDFVVDAQISSNDVTNPTQDITRNSSMPVLDIFYIQLCELIGQQVNGLIDKPTLDEHFSEFEIIGKTALDKWLKHLVEKGKLLKPNAKKKQYTLPK
jgi:predicted Rossmann fold nucleotide-binding protein DprA/Smf involved in DNA uptake